MQLRLAIAVAVIGCGNDIGLPSIDAAGVGGPPGSPMVLVSGPRLDESFYPTQTATITWVASSACSPTVASGMTPW